MSDLIPICVSPAREDGASDLSREWTSSRAFADHSVRLTEFDAYGFAKRRTAPGHSRGGAREAETSDTGAFVPNDILAPVSASPPPVSLVASRTVPCGDSRGAGRDPALNGAGTTLHSTAEAVALLSARWERRGIRAGGLGSVRRRCRGGPGEVPPAVLRQLVHRLSRAGLAFLVAVEHYRGEPFQRKIGTRTSSRLSSTSLQFKLRNSATASETARTSLSRVSSIRAFRFRCATFSMHHFHGK